MVLTGCIFLRLNTNALGAKAPLFFKTYDVPTSRVRFFKENKESQYLLLIAHWRRCPLFPFGTASSDLCLNLVHLPHIKHILPKPHKNNGPTHSSKKDKTIQRKIQPRLQCFVSATVWLDNAPLLRPQKIRLTCICTRWNGPL